GADNHRGEDCQDHWPTLVDPEYADQCRGKAADVALIGSLYAFVFKRFGMPSFVSTLSGLLAVLGLQLYILGATGSI
ncbi:hypothetical protein ACC672_37985, partial [Rhizobium ruizarguesonis]